MIRAVPAKLLEGKRRIGSSAGSKRIAKERAASESYRLKAADCDNRAAAATDAATRVNYQQIAEYWNDMAREARDAELMGRVHDDIAEVAKAAPECAVRYLAAELGPKDIRVHAISTGPLATRAASRGRVSDVAPGHRGLSRPRDRDRLAHADQPRERGGDRASGLVADRAARSPGITASERVNHPPTTTSIERRGP